MKKEIRNNMKTVKDFYNALNQKIESNKQSFNVNFNINNYGPCFSSLREVIDAYSRLTFYKYKYEKTDKGLQEFVNSGAWTQDYVRNNFLLKKEGWIKFIYIVGSSFAHLSSLSNVKNDDLLIDFLNHDDVLEICDLIQRYQTKFFIGNEIKAIDIYKLLPKIFNKVIQNMESSLEWLYEV